MKMKYIKNIALSLMAVVAIGCSEDLERANYISFESNSAELVTPLDGSGSGEFSVYTTTKSGSDRTFLIEVVGTSTADAEFYTVPTSVTVPKNSNVGTFTVESDAANIGKEIVLRFVPSESIYVGSEMKIGVFEECLENLLFMDIKFDYYSEEFAWQIYDAEDNFVAGNEGFGDYADFSEGQVRERVCLPAGTYWFYAYDAYGDGLDDGTITGSFNLRRVSDGAVLATGTGKFENGKEFEFILP